MYGGEVQGARTCPFLVVSRYTVKPMPTVSRRGCLHRRPVIALKNKPYQGGINEESPFGFADLSGLPAG